MIEQLDSFRKSKWQKFDPEFAKMIKENHPDIWAKGGNIKGNAQYQILSKISDQGGTANTKSQIDALELREAWVARHKQDFLLAGVIAQIKWLAVGSRGEDYMKRVVKDAIKKKTLKQSDVQKGVEMTPDQIGEYLEHQGASDEEIDEFLEHFGVKGMRWGVRRDKKSNNSKSSKSSKSEQTKKQGKKFLAVTAVGAASALGVYALLRNKKVANLSLSTIKSGRDAVSKSKSAYSASASSVKPAVRPKFVSYAKEIKELQDYILRTEKELGLDPPTPEDLAAAAKTLKKYYGV